MIRFLVFALIAATGLSAAQANIMVFLVDDMGVMDTSVPFLADEDGKPKRYPLNDHYRTPAMERLAARGIRFNQFYAMSVCSPTRISIMTGQNAARHRATNWIKPSADNRGDNGPPTWNWAGLKKGDVTLAGRLGEAGYRSIHVGKAHFGPTEHEGSEPLNLGFSVNVAGAAFGAPGSYYGSKKFGLGTKRAHNAVPHLEKYHDSDIFLSEALTIEAKKQVDAAIDAKTPFFLHFAHYAVHSPFESDPRFAANYTESGKPKNAQAFATLIEGMDKSLGDMLDHLEAKGIAEDTLIFFLGDNGSDGPLGHQHAVACAAPLRGKKGAHYEGGMRVPFIAAWAKPNANNSHQKKLPIAVGAIQSQMANVTDLFPTLLAVAGTTPPGGHSVDGGPLNRLLTGKADDAHGQQFLMHYPHGKHRSSYWTSWRNGDWKVIYHTFPDSQSEGARYQLYNLAKDPFESTNVAAEKPKILARMMTELVADLTRHNAVYPIDDAGKPLVPQLP
jgi:arylsulfatase A-like enzyme